MTQVLALTGGGLPLAISSSASLLLTLADASRGGPLGCHRAAFVSVARWTAGIKDASELIGLRTLVGRERAGDVPFSSECRQGEHGAEWLVGSE